MADTNTPSEFQPSPIVRAIRDALWSIPVTELFDEASAVRVVDHLKREGYIIVPAPTR